MTDTSCLLSDKQTQAYLERLGIEETPTPSLASLNRLVYAHQCAIPFETIAIYHCTTPPPLDLDVVFDKAITQKHGGYCFELNYLFDALLTCLGFDTVPVCGRIHVESGERRPILHRGILVRLDGKAYYVDVGFGGPIAAGALEFSDAGEQVVGNETFQMRRLDETWWAIDVVKRKKLDTDAGNGSLVIQTIMEITTTRLEEQDFAALNLACAQPGGRFWENCILNRRTPQGNCSIFNTVLTINNNAQKRSIELPTYESFVEAVKEHFGFNPLDTPLHHIEELFS